MLKCTMLAPLVQLLLRCLKIQGTYISTAVAPKLVTCSSLESPAKIFKLDKKTPLLPDDTIGMH